MDKTDHLMAEKNKNNKNSQKGQVTPKKYLKKIDLAYKVEFVIGKIVVATLNFDILQNVLSNLTFSTFTDIF